MQKPGRSGTPCRLEHHGPTSHEVDMHYKSDAHSDRKNLPLDNLQEEVLSSSPLD